MKKLFILFVLAWFPVHLFAQTNAASGTDNLKGHKALLFSVNELRLDALNGGFGIKKWYSNTHTLHFGLEFQYARDRKDDAESQMRTKTMETLVGTTFGFDKYLTSARSCRPFWGTEVQLQYQVLKSEISDIGGVPFFYRDYATNYFHDSKTTAVSIACYFCLGFEYFINQHLSLSGKYRLGGGYSKGKEKNQSGEYTIEQELSKTDVGISSSVLVLSVYF